VVFLRRLAPAFRFMPDGKRPAVYGYTEVEARFLYLAATHSGYFTVRQFLEFARAKSGKRNARLVEKLFALGHVSAQRYQRRSLVYHLHSRPIYDAIGKGELRNRTLAALGVATPLVQVKSEECGLDCGLRFSVQHPVTY
jgi:hypothetical protein